MALPHLISLLESVPGLNYVGLNYDALAYRLLSKIGYPLVGILNKEPYARGINYRREYDNKLLAPA
jgi:hypothetical protein